MPTNKQLKEITFADDGGVAIAMSEYVEHYYISGTDTLSGNWTITASGTPVKGNVAIFFYSATATLSGNTITILGTAMPDEYAQKRCTAVAYYTGAAWQTRFYLDASQTNVITTDQIIDKNITLAC